MNRRSEQRSQGNGGDFIRYVSLKNDGDMVLFRLVTESDAQYGTQSGVPHLFIQGEFHRATGQTKTGKTFYRDELCGMSFDEGANQWVGECKFCSDPENRARTQFFAWAYVYAFYHKQQDTRYIPGDSSTEKFKRKQVRRGTEAYFKEDVNQYCIWQDGYFMLQLVQGKVARFGVLCDRDYMVTRHGVARSSSTRRVLDDMAPTPMAQEIRDGASALPTLASVASNEVRTLGGKSTEKQIPDTVDLNTLPDELMLGTAVPGFSDSATDVDESLELFTTLTVPDELEDMASSVSGSSELDDIFGDLEAMADLSNEEIDSE
jgi:hypothetical protein